jgi:hypothetical protein
MEMTSRTIAFGLIVAALPAFSVVARASTQTQQQSVCGNEPNGEDCDCDVINDPGPDTPPQVQCNCQVTYGYVCHDVTVTVEVQTTPVNVNRYVNPNTGLHYFTTGSTAPAGYVFEKHAFSLANDAAYGATAFTLLSSGSGYFFANQSAIPNLVPLYGYFDPRKGETFYTTDPNETSSFPCLGAYCAYVDPVQHYCAQVVTPDCYYGTGVFGYVGQ